MEFRERMTEALRDGDMSRAVVFEALGSWKSCAVRCRGKAAGTVSDSRFFFSSHDDGTTSEEEQQRQKPPYAWTDLTRDDATPWKRWGSSLVADDPFWSTPAPGAVELAARWRSFGFAFWDEPRVRLLKQTPRLAAEFQTGWLEDAWRKKLATASASRMMEILEQQRRFQAEAAAAAATAAFSSQ
ncbi:hypothetical protein NLG97_g11300 [Lecanicillium saksenae]|uniref:Uncharacterized protein n=1 Tax=Lecanicillium saksenae TaxID=468837 RepID=A0ACC1QAT2_9HYPO|nr:hypothetical protein NLG97_g11300 [Lecanicillium saksenae]